MRKFSSREKKVEGGPLPEFPGRDAEPDRLPAKAGMHRAVWNLRYELPELVPNAIYDMGRPAGPLAVPGSYQVKLTVAGKSYTAPLDVKLDPRVSTAQADLEKQFDLGLQVRNLLGQAHGSVLEIRNLRAQLDALRKRLADHSRGAAILAAAEAIDKKMAAVEAELIEVKARSSQDMCNYPTKLNGKIAWLSDVVDSADRLPTRQAYEYTEEMRTRVNSQVGAWKEVLARDVAALNDRIRQENIPALTLPAKTGAGGR